MNADIGFDRCLSFIHCHMQPHGGAGPAYRGGKHLRAITISRQSGSGGHAVAERLAEYLRDHSPDDPVPWKVFDRDLVEKVLAEHHLPSRLARFMPEDRISEMADTMDELFGLHPPSWSLVRQTSETILHLAEVGNVILLGRGANVITRKLDYVFHVRLVGSWDCRVRRIQQQNHLSAAEARELVDREDLGRRRYLKKYFDQDIDDPLLYHLVINTDLLPCAEVARIIGEAVRPVTQLAKA